MIIIIINNMDEKPSIDTCKIGVFAAGWMHVGGFRHDAPKPYVNKRHFREDWILSDNFMFRPVALFMGDPERAPPSRVPSLRQDYVWDFNCDRYPHCGEGIHIRKKAEILEQVYDCFEFKQTVKRLQHFVHCVRQEKSRVYALVFWCGHGKHRSVAAAWLCLRMLFFIGFDVWQEVMFLCRLNYGKGSCGRNKCDQCDRGGRGNCAEVPGHVHGGGVGPPHRSVGEPEAASRVLRPLRRA